MRPAAQRCSPRGAWARLLLVLLLALAPALNLAAPVAPRDSASLAGTMKDTADVGVATATAGPCTHANVVSVHDGAGCGAVDHADLAHHADSHCLQCIAFGSPGLPGAPEIGTVVPLAVVAASYPCNPSLVSASHDDAAHYSRGPPAVV